MSVSLSIKKSRGFFGGVFQEDITQLFCHAGLCDRIMGKASMSVSSCFFPALKKATDIQTAIKGLLIGFPVFQCVLFTLIHFHSLCGNKRKLQFLVYFMLYKF